MSNSSKVKIWIALVFVLLVAVVSLNYAIDPLWVQSHSNSLNNKQPIFNERQQKTNKLVYGGMENYDSIMIGSSRGAMFDQNDFEDMKLFNYSSNNMAPWEYEGWIDVAKEIKGEDFKNIVIAIDFFGTQSHLDDQAKDPERDPQSYLTRARDTLYPYRSLMSLDTAKNAFDGLMNTLRAPKVEYYNRENVKYAMKVPDDQRDRYIQWNIEDHQKDFGESYKYKEDWVNVLSTLKAKNPKTNFIIITTPVSQQWFDAFVKTNHQSHYKKWLSETVSVFGEVHHFMDMNSVTKDLDNFFDAHHVYQNITQMMAKKVTNAESQLSSDFGVLLTTDNIEAYFNR